jgi:hypothetical protein
MRGATCSLSNANRKVAGVVTGEEVEVEVEIDAEPRVVVEPTDFARALDADPIARTAYDRLSRKGEHVLAIESAKKSRDAHTADREGPGHATGPGVGREPCGPRQDSTRSPLTSSRGSRLPARVELSASLESWLVANIHGSAERRLTLRVRRDEAKQTLCPGRCGSLAKPAQHLSWASDRLLAPVPPPASGSVTETP